MTYIERKKLNPIQQSHLANIVRVIRKFYVYHGIGNNPAEKIIIQGIIRKGPPDFIPEITLEQIYNTYSIESYLQLRRKIELGLIIYQAAETGELAKIKMHHVGPNTRTIRLLGTRNQARTLMLLNEQKDLLTQYMNHQEGQNTEYLINNNLHSYQMV